MPGRWPAFQASSRFEAQWGFFEMAAEGLNSPAQELALNKLKNSARVQTLSSQKESWSLWAVFLILGSAGTMVSRVASGWDIDLRLNCVVWTDRKHGNIHPA